jgi:hypothetical protein
MPEPSKPLFKIKGSGLSGPISVFAEDLSIYAPENQKPRVFLNKALDFSTLEEILSNSLFNIQLQLLSPSTEDNLKPDIPAHLTLLLNPDHWTLFDKYAGDTTAIHDFLQKDRRTKEFTSLQEESSWLALKITQSHENEKKAFRTYWSFCDWEAAAKGEDIGQVLYNGFMAFAKESGLAKELGDAVGSELMGSDLIQSLLESFISSEESEEKEEPHESTEESVDSLSNVFSKLIDDTLGNPASLFDSTPEPSPTSLFNQLIQFLVAEDWGFTRMPGEESLQIDFQGSSLRWICYARVLSENHYLLFYSYYPLPVEQKDYIRIHEFLALANLDMINGNFEFDTEEGHIRYKTSLWTGQKELSREAFRQLIFSNVNIADDYFPALERMVREGVSAKEVLKG